jgi:hypothetical protein
LDSFRLTGAGWYVSDASGINEVYVGTLPEFSNARQISANGGSRPRWRANDASFSMSSPMER